MTERQRDGETDRETETDRQTDNRDSERERERERESSELRTLLHKDYDFRQLPIFTICPC